MFKTNAKAHCVGCGTPDLIYSRLLNCVQIKFPNKITNVACQATSD